MENGTSQEMLIFLLQNGTAVLIIGRSREEGRISRKVFLKMCGIGHRETKNSVAAHPAIIGIIREVLVDSG